MVTDDQAVRRLARSSGLSRAEVRRFLDLDLVAYRNGRASPAMVLRLRRVRRLRRDLGLSLDAVAIIVRLLDRIEKLERTAPRRAVARIVDDG